MQVHLSNKIPSKDRSGYLDPQLLAKTVFDYPSKWELNCKELARGETIQEKEEIQRQRIRKECYKVAAYISTAFSRMQDKNTIYLPYNFE
jgi:hypothetical protein